MEVEKCDFQTSSYYWFIKDVISWGKLGGIISFTYNAILKALEKQG